MSSSILLMEKLNCAVCLMLHDDGGGDDDYNDLKDDVDEDDPR